MSRYEAVKTVLSSKGRGSGVVKRKNVDDKNPVVKKEDLITVFSENDDSSPKTYKKAREYASEIQRETRGMKKGGSIKDAVESVATELKRGISSTEDSVSRSLGTKRGVELDKELGFRDQKGEKVLLPKTTQKQRAEIRDMQYLRKGLQKQTESEAEKRRETRGLKKGGYVKAADGIAMKGKTKGKII